MLHTPIAEDKIKDNRSKAQSEPEFQGIDRSSGWTGYSSLSLGGENRFSQVRQGNDRSQGWQPIGLSSLSQGGVLQRKCDRSSSAGFSGNCSECQGKEGAMLQTKLSIGAPDDQYEREADRVADQVMSMSTNSVASRTPPRIQRFTGASAGPSNMTAPVSVDRVLSSPGSPLEAGLQQDMGQRFGHDFSRVRVHTDAAAARSAQDLNAHAYTVGYNIIFGEGQFTPDINSGHKLLSHELVHVVQQNSSETGHRILRAKPNKKNLPKKQQTSKIISTTRTAFEATMQQRLGVTTIRTGEQKDQELDINLRNGAPKISIPNWKPWDPGSDSSVYTSIIQSFEDFNQKFGGLPQVTEIRFFEKEYERDQNNSLIVGNDVGADFGGGKLNIYRKSTTTNDVLPSSRSNKKGEYSGIVSSGLRQQGSVPGAPLLEASQDLSTRRFIVHELGHGLIENANAVAGTDPDLAIDSKMIDDYKREVGWTSSDPPQLFDIGIQAVADELAEGILPSAQYQITVGDWNSPQWVEQPISHYSVTKPGEDFAEAVMTFIYEPKLLLNRSPHRYNFLNSRKVKWLKGLRQIPKKKTGELP